MLAPTSTFHEMIKDPSAYRQNLVLEFENGYFSANDGDIEQGGVQFEEYFCTDEDLVYGECPSSTMKASLINKDQALRSFTWGKCRAYIGVLESSGEHSFVSDDINTAVDLPGNHTVVGKSDGLYVDGTLVKSGECYSLIRTVDDDFNYVFVFGDGYCGLVKYDLILEQMIAYKELPSNRFMNDKMRTPKTIEWDGDHAYERIFSCTVYQDGMEYDWMYAPMGVYYVEKPSNLSGDVVDIEEAQDAMRNFNVDATDFLEKFYAYRPNGGSITDWFSTICPYAGVVAETPETTDTNLYIYNPSSACTLRDILAWLAEAFKGVFRIDRKGYMQLYTVGTDPVEEIGLDRIEARTMSMAEFVTKPTTKLVNKNLGGITYIEGRGDNGYYILGNPFVQDNENVTLADVRFYSYAPMAFTCLEADPLVDVGDAVSVWLTDEEYSAFVDEYNRLFTDENDRVYVQANTPVKTPLMHRILRWNGVCTADYEATGNPVRLVPSEVEQINYNANIANDTEGLINRLLVGNLFAQYIEATNFHLKGGTIDIHTGAETDDVIELTYQFNSVQKATTAFSPRKIEQIYETETYKTSVTLDANSSAPSVKVVRSVVGNGARCTVASIQPSGIFLRYILGSSDEDDAVTRMELTTSGLNFYDSSGNLTNSYPAT